MLVVDARVGVTVSKHRVRSIGITMRQTVLWRYTFPLIGISGTISVFTTKHSIVVSAMRLLLGRDVPVLSSVFVIIAGIASVIILTTNIGIVDHIPNCCLVL